MTRTRAVAITAGLLMGATSASLAPISWEDMTPADWIYSLATRSSLVEGHEVDYPTPTKELVSLLEQRSEPAAARYLADARMATGDAQGAVAAIETWASSQGAVGWDEAAHWAADHHLWEVAFRAAERALPQLPSEPQRALADMAVQWAEAHPEAAAPLAWRERRARLFPSDGAVVEDWLRALEQAGRLEELSSALAATNALDAERRLLLRSDLEADHGHPKEALAILDAAIEKEWSVDVRRAFAQRVDRGDPEAPERWRTLLDGRFDRAAAIRLQTYFQGSGRGGDAMDLLRQLERRHEGSFQRGDWLVVARLHSEIDAIPEAFRARLAAAQGADPAGQSTDLAALALLALRAGSRPLAWGSYNDEPYRWVARVDRTPGFWTGGISFLLTGQDWAQALAHLESQSLAQRTFATARALVDELTRRSPNHGALPGLRVAIMRRHVERGEGREALALLPQLEAGPPDVADEARSVALLAARQVDLPLSEEVRLFRARLASMAPDGSRPSLARNYVSALGQGEDSSSFSYYGSSQPPPNAWARVRRARRAASYGDLLEEAVTRLDARDRSHRTSVSLLLGEMDRMPDAEDLWLNLAGRLSGWRLDDELGPRYKRALERFTGPSWWARLARWYAARSKSAELRHLAEDLAQRFRGAAIFERTAKTMPDLPIPEQPTANGGVRLVAWADWVRLKALERFPHSTAVFREAQSHLVRQSAWDQAVREGRVRREHWDHRVIVPDTLVDQRETALLFLDGTVRERFFAERMQQGRLAALLEQIEKQPTHTPVEDRLLEEGWARLSQFERATPAADRLAKAYPGDAVIARSALTLHRSLAGLEPAQAVPARQIVARTAPALLDPNTLWTELGELEEEAGRPDEALATWAHITERDPRDTDRVEELATLLWDYNHPREALATIEDARSRLDQPHLLAFEAGVLREEVHDIDGAVREYLTAALPPKDDDCFCSWFENDQRSLRRLSQLLGREGVRRRVETRIQALQPGDRQAEEALMAYFPLGTIEAPTPGLDWDADDWIDRMDMPNDPVGRGQREARRAEGRGGEHSGITAVRELLLDKAQDMIPRATSAKLLDAVDHTALPLIRESWPRADQVTFQDVLLARRAELATTEEERVRREVERATLLASEGRVTDADALWTRLESRIQALPEGAPRIHAEVEHVAYVERTRGAEAARDGWAALSRSYPWSRGILDDRAAFLERTGHGSDARALIEATIPRAAAGHREQLLERLTQDALGAGDLAQARRAVTLLLDTSGLDDARRLGALRLLARLRYREDPAFDALALASSQAPRFPEPLRPEVYQSLALAASDEEQWHAASDLWIEALNRRLERPWLDQAMRASDRAGRAAALRTFFERQMERSPRDVRWAVAVREIRRHQRDVDGAIAAARAAVEVRPERESLWRELADLLVRADRLRDAADTLGEWNKPRLADEGVAAWRSQLYARAGLGQRSFAIERDALQAFDRENADNGDRAEEARQRAARAARRLIEHGHPDLAWKLLSPTGRIAPVASSALDDDEQAQLALATGKLISLMEHRIGDEAFRSATARVLRERGRPEDRASFTEWVVPRLLPPQTGTADSTALDRLWPFVQESGLEPPVRIALARTLLGSRPGPWQNDTSLAFIENVGSQIVQVRGGRRTLILPAIEPLWLSDLVRRDRPDLLVAFLGEPWIRLLDLVNATTPLPRSTKRLAWAGWLDDPQILATWARAAGDDPASVRALSPLFSDRRHWDRLWLLAARRWDVSPILAILPDKAQRAWFDLWVADDATVDPVLRARRVVTQNVAEAVGALIANEPNAVRNPLIGKLRGPRTVGDVLGHDPAWLWPEFTPRRDASGTSIEKGDDRFVGQGADAGRLPGVLWGERPGEAWYVLEALARLREGDRSAPQAVLEVPQRGGELQRVRVAIRLAEALGETDLAARLAEAHLGATDLAQVSDRLRLLVAQGRKGDAARLYQKRVLQNQRRMTDSELRTLEGIGQDLGFPSPLDLLDHDVPVAPALLAYLYDRRDGAATRNLHTSDDVGFRAALAARWSGREARLSEDQLHAWITILWVNNAAPLPRRALRRLGGFWRAAADWLESQRVADRAAAAAAVAALPGAELPQGLCHTPAQETTDLLRLRLDLARGDRDGALALAETMLDALSSEKPLALEALPPTSTSEGVGDDGGWDPSSWEGQDSEPWDRPADVLEPPESDALAQRLSAWLAPLREAGQVDLVRARFAQALASRRAEGRVPVASWRLALTLADSEQERASILAALEDAWLRGDWPPERLGELVDALAVVAPDQAPRWLRRWPERFEYSQVVRRARAFARIKDPASAATTLAEGARRGPWTAEDEMRAFDDWRRLPLDAPDGPEAWKAALPFWRGKAGTTDEPLGAHLQTHPFDYRAARTVLRTIDPGPEPPLRLALAAMEAPATSDRGERDSDQRFVDVRIARGLLPRSWRAASAAVGTLDARDLADDLARRSIGERAIEATLVDLARMATAAGNESLYAAALDELADVQSSQTSAIRAEHAAARVERPRPFHLVAGRPTPYRPRDLTWAMLGDILAAEASR